MTLIRSISGIRGTIGGIPKEGLTPVDLVLFSTAFSQLLRQKTGKQKITVVIGRDARISGPMVSQVVTGTLQGCGVDVKDLGLTTTPTVEMAVTALGADGGIILTASHNQAEWNALKLLNSAGEFISATDGEELLRIAEGQDNRYAEVTDLGSYEFIDGQIEKHIRAILRLALVDVDAIRKRDFSVVFDSINSTGGIALPMLLDALGVRKIWGIHAEPTGLFAHNPEPLPENLQEIRKVVKETGADVGFVVDPDVDRLAMVMENGEFFGEEYTLVAVSDYVLQYKKGNTVSNLSSTRALRDVTEKYGKQHFASAVGEVNVVEKMKMVDAVIGGEGNGGVIYPALHYGRDALVGIALFLTHLAKSGLSCSQLRSAYPDYFISKNKIQLGPGINTEKILNEMAAKYSEYHLNEVDGLRIDFPGEWVHLRRSNTEPVIRIYAESGSPAMADALARKIMDDISRSAC
jgi:phosphomannomutase